MPTIGTCSNCRGPVQTPELWGGDALPVPTCSRCGATAKNAHGPVIPMETPRQDILAQPPMAQRGGWKP